MDFLISGSTISNLTGTFDKLFNTMSIGRNSYITVIKSPLEIINNSNQNTLVGYGAENLNSSDITYIPVTGVFPAQIIYPYKNMPSEKFESFKFDIDKNAIYIKVKKEARDFILDGKTEYIIADEHSYINQETPQVQNYFGLKYYYFKLNSNQ